MRKNDCIKCDVRNCRNNLNGENCALTSIQVTGESTENAHYCKSFECDGTCE